MYKAASKFTNRNSNSGHYKFKRKKKNYYINTKYTIKCNSCNFIIVSYLPLVDKQYILMKKHKEIKHTNIIT